MARRTRIATLVAIAGTILALGTSVASAQTDEPTRSVNQPFIVLTGRLVVDENATVEDAIIFDGDAVIEGRVTGNVVAVNGDILVDGEVLGDVIAINGAVAVSQQGSVGGDVMSRLDPQLDGDVGGQVQRNGLRTDGLLVIGRIAFWIAASISSLLFGLLWLAFFPRGGEAVATAARTVVGGSIGFGFLLFLGIPVLGLIMLVTIVGGLFGVALLTGMVLLYSVAYTAGALALGRLLLKEPKKIILAFLVGWVILRILALVPVLGGAMFVAAAVWGFGAIAVAAWRGGRIGGRGTPVPALAAAETPPMPPLP